jgi:hypothetical protein
MSSDASGAGVRTVVQCYSLFDKFFPTCGLLDYTEGIYHDDPNTPYPSASAREKKTTLQTTSGTPVHSFRTLLAELGTYCLHDCVAGANGASVSFKNVNEPTPLHAEAFRLVKCSQN